MILGSAALLSGRAVLTSEEDQHGAVNLPEDEWKHYRANGRTASNSEQQLAAWHDFQARQSDLEGNHAAASFHLKQLMLLRPRFEKAEVAPAK